MATIMNLKTIREEQMNESPSIVPKIASTQSGVKTKLIMILITKIKNQFKIILGEEFILEIFIFLTQDNYTI